MKCIRKKQKKITTIKETTLTIEEIENILVGRLYSHFYIRKKKVAKLQEKERKTEMKKTLKKDDQEFVVIDK